MNTAAISRLRRASDTAVLAQRLTPPYTPLTWPGAVLEPPTDVYAEVIDTGGAVYRSPNRRVDLALFRYKAGDDIAAIGGTFTRPFAATYVAATGDLKTAPPGKLRDDHHVRNPVTGLLERTVLLEGQRTNSLHNSDTPATQTRTLAAGTYTLWVVGSGSCALSGGASGTATEAAPVTFTLAASVGVTFTVSGTLARFQCENGPFASSYIPTTGSPATRAADSLSFAYPHAPQPTTTLVRFIEHGSGWVSNARLMEHGTTATDHLLIPYGRATGKYGINVWDNNVSHAIGDSPNLSMGDLVELCVSVAPAGKATSTWARNGVVGAQVQSPALPTRSTYGQQARVRVNSSGSANNGFNAFTHLVISPDVRTLAQMRRIAGVG